MLAALFISTSFFLHSYFLIGYPNPLAVFFLCALHAAWGSWSARENSTPLVAIGLGCLTGLTFYVYLGPLIILSVAPYVLYKLWKTKSRLALLGFLLLSALCAIGIATPGLLQSNTLRAMARVSSQSPEFRDRTQIISNIGNCFRLFWWNPRLSHFIAGPYLDQITLGCFVAGLVAMALRRRIGSLLFVVSFSLLAILIGATSPYAYPATTRGVVFIPFGCLAAAIGFDWLTRRLPRLIQSVSAIALLGALAASNMQRAEAYFTLQRMPLDLVFLRDLRTTLAQCPMANTVRAHYANGTPLHNILPNLSFFTSVQVGRPITIVLAGQPLPAGADSTTSVCEFHFESPAPSAN
jgi:hypothetical protein